MFKLKKLTNAEILEILEIISEEKENIRLTPTNRAFFIALYNYIRKNGIYDVAKKKYYIQLTNIQLAEILGFSFTSTSVSLNALKKCGAIERVRCNEFKKISDKEYNVNKPSLTYINSSFLKNY